MKEVKDKAKAVGVSPGKMKKGDIIRAIQMQEGNFPCFQTAAEFCDQESCYWRDDCLSA